MTPEEMGEIKTLEDYAQSIINGIGGWKSFEQSEFVVCTDRDLAIAMWTIRCLANNKSEGSELVVNEIIKKRNAARDGVRDEKI